jgi:uncharacterized protein YfaS (alpha-2-macroglobulin family)
MAVAWSKDKVGRAVGDVTIRDPVVLTATLPRFLLNGDRGTMHLDLDNVAGQGGDYRLEVKSDGVDVVGNVPPQTLKLDAKQRGATTVPLSASGAGNATVIVRVSGPGGFALERSYALAVRPATQILARRTVKPLAKGQSLTLSNDLFADLVPGSASVALSVCGGAAGGARSLSVRMLGANHEPRIAAALRQRSRGQRPSCARHRGRPAPPRGDRPPAGASRLQRLVRAVVCGR